MEMSKAFGGVFTALGVVLAVLILPVYAQTTSSSSSSSLCTSSMVRSFTPCMNYLTGSSSSGSSSPTADCCASLKLLMSNGLDCLCEMIMGGVPFSIPFNRNLAISLPRACGQSGVPIECKATPGAPLPAPGPAVFSPFASPAAYSPGPSGFIIPVDITPAVTPFPDTTSDAPPASSTIGTSSIVTPSAAISSLSQPHTSLLLSLVAAMIMKYL